MADTTWERRPGGYWIAVCRFYCTESKCFVTMYKKLGLNMRPTNAAFKTGGFALEAGIAEMESRFATGRLKVAQHLTEVLDEYVGYHRVDNLINKVDDDLMSAIRVGLMDLRYAKPLGGPNSFSAFRREQQQQVAANIDFDVFTGLAYEDA
jgi:hypothetical protein